MSSEKMILIAGPCAIEDRDTAFRIAEHVKTLADRLDIRYVFKGSFKKANRTRLDSFSGIERAEALAVLRAVGDHFDIPVLTDVHESHDCAEAAEFVDYLQIPAFLCRQTELLLAAGSTGKGVNIKKGQFLSPEAMQFALEKVRSTGNDKVWLTERGTTFGYESLVVDFTGIPRMQKFGAPVILDATHALQRPNQTTGVTGGDPELIETMCLAGCAVGADGLFIETHPAPHTAQSDSQSMLQMDRLAGILEKCVRVREAVGG